MNVAQFLKLSNPVNYDFSNDGANDLYHELNGYDKFFAYMAVAKAYTQQEENIMKFGAEYSKLCKQLYRNIPDPDSASKLLQEIYSLLWDNNGLQYCKDENGIKGETMNSQNTTIGVLYELIESEADKRERCAVKVGRGVQKVSIRYILSRYSKEKERHIKLFDEIVGMRNFMETYHTLGNFIPVPVGCNTPRGTGRLKDYWDLTLKVIYEYYEKGMDNIKDIAGDEKAEVYKRWLDSFGNWQEFVKKNYMDDFVKITLFKKYGEPKELWDGHFTGTVLPKNKKQVEQYYSRASQWITARGQRMLVKLQEKL